MECFVHDFPDAVVIGGWASDLRTRTAKSHDIDVSVDHATLSRLRSKYELSPSSHPSGREFEAIVLTLTSAPYLNPSSVVGSAYRLKS